MSTDPTDPTDITIEPDTPETTDPTDPTPSGGETEVIEIPTIDCMKKAIWSAIKTKSNFIRSTYLQAADSTETAEIADMCKTTYGPWTDEILFTNNLSKTGGDIHTQVALNNVYTRIEPIEVSETTGEITGGITEETLEEIAPVSVSINNMDKKFFDSSATSGTATLNVDKVQVFEAHSLGLYLKSLQDVSGRDTRVSKIIKDVYDVEDGSIVPEPEQYGPNSVLIMGDKVSEVTDMMYGENGTITAPEQGSVLYDLYGPNAERNGGLKADAKTMKADLYGQSSTSSFLNPDSGSMKWITQQTIRENGVLMEMADYIFLTTPVEGSVSGIVESQYFNEDNIGYKIKYTITRSTAQAGYSGSVIGKDGAGNELDLAYDETEERYPALKKVVIEYYTTANVFKSESFIVAK